MVFVFIIIYIVYEFKDNSIDFILCFYNCLLYYKRLINSIWKN